MTPFESAVCVVDKLCCFAYGEPQSHTQREHFFAGESRVSEIEIVSIAALAHMEKLWAHCSSTSNNSNTKLGLEDHKFGLVYQENSTANV